MSPAPREAVALGRARSLGLCLLPLVALACSFTSLDDLQGAGGSSSGTGAGSTSTGSSTSATASSGSAATGTGGGSATGSGGAGGDASGGGGSSVVPLIDTGLLVRYFIDDAAEGTTQTEVADSAPTPLPLSIVFDRFDAGMEWVSESGHRGLHWSNADGEGIASRSIAATKMLALNQSVFGTLEVVARIEVATISGSRLLHMGTGSDSGFTLAVSHVDQVNEIAPPTQLEMRTRADSGVPETPFYRIGHFNATFGPDRVVVHAVYDSRQKAPQDRVRMYLGGIRLPTSASEEPLPEENEEILVDGSDVLAIGNRQIGDRSIGGTIFYAAAYLAPLTDAEIAQNAASLAVRDDR